MDVLLVNAPKLQLILILAVVLVELELTSKCAPYIDDTDDVFAEIAQWCTVAILLFSIALKVEAIKPESSGVGVLFVLPLFAVIIALVGYGIVYAWKDVSDVPQHVIAKNKPKKTRAFILEFGRYGRSTTRKPRSAEAGLDSTHVKTVRPFQIEELKNPAVTPTKKSRRARGEKKSNPALPADADYEMNQNPMLQAADVSKVETSSVDKDDGDDGFGMFEGGEVQDFSLNIDDDGGMNPMMKKTGSFF